MRGSLDNDSLTEDEINQIEADRAAAEQAQSCAKMIFSWPTRSTSCAAWPRSICKNRVAGAGASGPFPSMTPEEISALPYRPNVGIMLVNSNGLVFVAQRIDNPGPAWQMPQGGIDAGEDTRAAALRELAEETGVMPELVTVLAEASNWLRYDLPHELVPQIWDGRWRGQNNAGS